MDLMSWNMLQLSNQQSPPCWTPLTRRRCDRVVGLLLCPVAFSVIFPVASRWWHQKNWSPAVRGDQKAQIIITSTSPFSLLGMSNFWAITYKKQSLRFSDSFLHIMCLPSDLVFHVSRLNKTRGRSLTCNPFGCGTLIWPEKYRPCEMGTFCIQKNTFQRLHVEKKRALWLPICDQRQQ